MDEQGPVKKRVVNIGVGGQIEAPAALVEAEPRSIVDLRVEAVLGAEKRKFEGDGSVSISHILTLDAGTFVVVAVQPPLPIPEQDTIPGTDED